MSNGNFCSNVRAGVGTGAGLNEHEQKGWTGRGEKGLTPSPEYGWRDSKLPPGGGGAYPP
eukprot:746076-Hanusia_phi.AAC.3